MEINFPYLPDRGIHARTRDWMVCTASCTVLVRTAFHLSLVVSAQRFRCQSSTLNFSYLYTSLSAWLSQHSPSIMSHIYFGSFVSMTIVRVEASGDLNVRCVKGSANSSKVPTTIWVRGDMRQDTIAIPHAQFHKHLRHQRSSASSLGRSYHEWVRWTLDSLDYSVVHPRWRPNLPFNNAAGLVTSARSQ